MKKLLLHSCCGPCSTHVINVLKNDYDITILYYNPNIDTLEEFNHRLSEQKRYCEAVGVKVIELPYDSDEYLTAIEGLENEPEGGSRCEKCFRLRLEKTAAYAKEHGYEAFATTLTVSPHKNSLVINRVGKEIEAETHFEFIDGNFKKQDGYKKSVELAKEFNLYRQNYCGCKFSKRKEG